MGKRYWLVALLGMSGFAGGCGSSAEEMSDESEAAAVEGDSCRIINSASGTEIKSVAFMLGSSKSSANPDAPWINTSHRVTGDVLAKTPELYGKANRYVINAGESDVTLYAFGGNKLEQDFQPVFSAPCTRGNTCSGELPAGFSLHSLNCQREFASKALATKKCKSDEALCSANNALLPMSNPVIPTSAFIDKMKKKMSASITTTPFWSSGLQGVHDYEMGSTGMIWGTGADFCSGSNCKFERYNDVLHLRQKMRIELNAALGTWYDVWIHIYLHPVLENGGLRFHWISNDVKAECSWLYGPANHSGAIVDKIMGALDDVNIQSDLLDGIRTESGKKVCSAVAAYCKSNASNCDIAKAFCDKPDSPNASTLSDAGNFVIGTKQRLQFSLSSWPAGTDSLPMTIKSRAGGMTRTLSNARFLKSGLIAPDIILNADRSAD